MKYNMPTLLRKNNWIAVASQKHYISVYTCSETHIALFKKKHPGIKTGKGCINFRDRDEIPFEDLKEVIERAMIGKD